MLPDWFFAGLATGAVVIGIRAVYVAFHQHFTPLQFVWSSDRRRYFWGTLTWGAGWLVWGTSRIVFPYAFGYLGPIILGVGFFMMLEVPCGIPWIEKHPLRRAIRNAVFLVLGGLCIAYGIALAAVRVMRE